MSPFTTPSRFRRAGALAIGGVLAIGLAACSADDSSAEGTGETLELTVATNTSETTVGGLSTQWFADAVEEATDGRITMDIQPAGALLAGTEIIPGIGDGRVDMGHSFSVYHPAEMPLFNVAGLPFVSDDAVASAEALQDLYNDNELFASEFDKFGIRPLFFNPVGSSSIGTTETPIETLGDLDGLQLRATGFGPTVNDAVGVESVYMDFGEQYESLERGLIDGWSASAWSGSAESGMTEVAPYYTQPGIGTFAAAGLFIGTDVWDSLSEEDQEIFMEVGAEYYDWIVSEFMDIEAASCDRLLEDGGSVSVLSDADVDEWASLVGDSVRDEIIDNAVAVGDDADEVDAMITEYQDTVASLDGESGYVDGLTLCAER